MDIPHEIVLLIRRGYISQYTYNTACLVSKEWHMEAAKVMKQELIECLEKASLGAEKYAGRIGFNAYYHKEWKCPMFQVTIMHGNITWRWDRADCMYVITEFEYNSGMSAHQFLYSVMKGLTTLVGNRLDPFTEDDPRHYCCCDECIHIVSPRWCNIKSIAPYCQCRTVGAEILIRHKKISYGDYVLGLICEDGVKIGTINYKFAGNYKWIIQQ